MLRVAWGELSRYGDKSPGPDGLVASDLDEPEIWRLLRAISQSIRSEKYRPGQGRRVSISKGAGRGERTLTIQNLADRVVAKAVALTIEPLFESGFDDRSFGFRPNRGRLHALATAMTLTEREDRPVWLVNDIRDAFDRVPRKRLLDILRTTLPDDLVTFIGQLADTGAKRGLRQGSPLSPLLLNIYADHFVDQPWRRHNPDLPLLRTVDDLLVLCRDHMEALDVDAELRRMLVPSGLPLKYSREDSIRDLSAGVCADWLGFVVDRPERTEPLRVSVGEAVWARLVDRLEDAHRQPVPPLVAQEAVMGWIGQLGPCYAAADRRAVCMRVRKVAEDQAFDEVAHVEELDDYWREAYLRWEQLRTEVVQQMSA